MKHRDIQRLLDESMTDRCRRTRHLHPHDASYCFVQAVSSLFRLQPLPFEAVASAPDAATRDHRDSSRQTIVSPNPCLAAHVRATAEMTRIVSGHPDRVASAKHRELRRRVAPGGEQLRMCWPCGSSGSQRIRGKWRNMTSAAAVDVLLAMETGAAMFVLSGDGSSSQSLHRRRRGPKPRITLGGDWLCIT
ncbi:hypothetical protein P154DRAFT_2876 [Amniculicola lignicola CBS 123094]|uniref:Uncharacterized protein n=1 Tax=Amniculicola lignicola CBS 123094 TaxID=1392246 RepID=A0A6A5X478_9PLEO|nr:hypothetical protein P154DRAFT_2876 [Amniculicola lignicola CBS 123094]